MEFKAELKWDRELEEYHILIDGEETHRYISLTCDEDGTPTLCIRKPKPYFVIKFRKKASGNLYYFAGSPSVHLTHDPEEAARYDSERNARKLVPVAYNLFADNLEFDLPIISEIRHRKYD